MRENSGKQGEWKFMQSEEKISEILLEIGAVSLQPQKPFRWASGILSPIYCDNRLLLSYPKERKEVIAAFAEKAKQIGLENFDVIAGVESSGIPHAAWLSELLEKPMVYVRKKQKDHGKENLVEGKLEKGQKAIIVEDLISTGGSLFACVEGVREQGGVVENCLAIFTYGMQKSAQGAKEHNVQLHALTNFSSLVKTAAEKKYIQKKEIEIVLDFAKDPEKWAGKSGLQ